MKTKKVQKEEDVAAEISCERCGNINCTGGNCAYGNCQGGVCSYHGKPCRSMGWRIFSVIFRMIIMVIILSVVFALGAVVGGAGTVRYMNGGDNYLYGPGMMSKGISGNWEYKTEGMMGSRDGFERMIGCGALNNSQQGNVRIFGNIVSVGAGEVVISDNAGKDVTVVSGTFTIIETSKGEIGIKDLKVDEGVTVYGTLIEGGNIKAKNIKVSR